MVGQCSGVRSSRDLARSLIRLIDSAGPSAPTHATHNQPSSGWGLRRGKPTAGDGTRFELGRGPTALGSSTLPLSAPTRVASPLEERLADSWRRHPGANRTRPKALGSSTLPLSALTRPPGGIWSPKPDWEGSTPSRVVRVLLTTGEASRQLATAPGWKPGEAQQPLGVRPSLSPQLDNKRAEDRSNQVGVAQGQERCIADAEVVGSNPITHS